MNEENLGNIYLLSQNETLTFCGTGKSVVVPFENYKALVRALADLKNQEGICTLEEVRIIAKHALKGAGIE